MVMVANPNGNCPTTRFKALEVLKKHTDGVTCCAANPARNMKSSALHEQHMELKHRRVRYLLSGNSLEAPGAKMTTMLTNYDDFVVRVEALGFMTLSPLVSGLPSLGDETSEDLWHTGLDTDPWCWKDRVAAEKRLAYGCILGGHKGFVAARMYPIFYAASHPSLSMPERWASGTVHQNTWRLWQLFEERGSLTTSQIRQALGASRKLGASAVNTAIQNLQQAYYITVAGSERKISAKGEFYGWPVNRYCRVADWAPDGWLDGVKDWSAQEARELLLDDGVAMSKSVKRNELAKKLGWQ